MDVQRDKKGDTLYVIDVLDDPKIPLSQRLAHFCEAESLNCPYQIVDGIHQSESLSDIFNDHAAGILVSGSVHSVYEQAPWIRDLEKFIQGAFERRIPTFGICFGHQAIASALGGKVERLPRMREFGTLPVYLLEDSEHPYLEGFESGTITVQTHQDYVAVLPPEAKALGFSKITENQIFSIGSCFGIQFHPEYSIENLRGLAQIRKSIFLQEALFHSPIHLENYIKTFTATDRSRVILSNFIRSLDV